MAQPTKFLMTRDINGYNGFGLKPANNIYGVNLAQNVAQTLVTVPSTYKRWIAIFSVDPGLRVFAAANTTASSYTVTAGTASSELNPIAWEVNAGDTISVLTPDLACYVGVKLYALSTQ